ncbi:hypothetical protein CHS0354_040382 [Potamilus streckersoni]|uniref:XK-related protein n=1 Tax=Potamilus streckersoni TaxID=2493646 RepID=A0AAE0S1C7_9BIVA|nr:hypothetical protein CHS0354_040382 [Potamilus streckersoni]
MDDKTPASVKGILDKDEVKDQDFYLEEHSIEGIDYEKKDVSKGDCCSSGKGDTNTNINSKEQSHKKIDEDRVEVQTSIQGDLAEEKRKDEQRTKNVKFDRVKNEQTVLSTSERFLKDQCNCANSKKNSAGIEDDQNIDEELIYPFDEMDASFGTREPLNLPFIDYRESIMVESPVTPVDIYYNGGVELQEEDVMNGGSNDYTDLEKCSERTVVNGKKFNENCLNEKDFLIDDAVNSEVSRKSSFSHLKTELSEDGNRASKFIILRNSVRRLERPMSVFATTVSVLLFLADIITDCLLAGEYYTEAKMGLFFATVVFIIGPAVIISVVDLSWLYIDIKKRHSSKPRSNDWTNFKWILTLRVLFGVFSFGRIVRCVQYIYHYLVFTKIQKSETGKRKRERSYHRSRAKEERRDFCMLDFINAFTESGLQLMVQLFLFFQYDLNLDVIRVSSLCTSWISIAWTLVSYYHYNRDAISRKQALKLLGIGTCFLARASELAARITAIAIFVTFFHFWGFFLVFHFLGMLLWLFYFSRPKLDDIASTKFGKFLYTILYAFVLNFCFINLEDKRTFRRMLVFYIIQYSESFTMATAVLINALQHDGIHSYKIQSLIIVPLGCVIHLVAQIMFYLCCHPTVSKKYHSSKCVQCK